MNDCDSTGAQEYDPILGWVRAVPLPFYVRSWRTWFRWRPCCYEHDVTFRNDDEWGEHYLKAH